MKDYKLSEIRKMCRNNFYTSCIYCPFYIQKGGFCAMYNAHTNKFPYEWEIDNETDKKET